MVSDYFVLAFANVVVLFRGKSSFESNQIAQSSFATHSCARGDRHDVLLCMIIFTELVFFLFNCFLFMIDSWRNVGCSGSLHVFCTGSSWSFRQRNAIPTFSGNPATY